MTEQQKNIYKIIKFLDFPIFVFCFLLFIAMVTLNILYFESRPLFNITVGNDIPNISRALNENPKLSELFEKYNIQSLRSHDRYISFYKTTGEKLYCEGNDHTLGLEPAMITFENNKFHYYGINPIEKDYSKEDFTDRLTQQFKCLNRYLVEDTKKQKIKESWTQ